jgi:hypothetical protein
MLAQLDGRAPLSGNRRADWGIRISRPEEVAVADFESAGRDALEQAQPATDPEEPVADGDTEPDLEAPEDDVAEQHEALHGAEHGGAAEHSVEFDPADVVDEPVGDDEDEDDYRRHTPQRSDCAAGAA